MINIPRSDDRLRIAVQKSGRLSKKSIGLIESCGVKFSMPKDRLLCHGQNMDVDLLLVRDDDIPGLLDRGVADLGIVGSNVADEYRLHKGDQVNWREVRSMGYGSCRLSIAVPEDLDYRGLDDLNGQTIATSYPALTRHYLKEAGVDAETVEFSGSVEVAPTLGAAHAIADLVSTGSTLRANHLLEVETITACGARLYRAQDIGAGRQAIMDRLLPRIEGVLQAQESKYVMMHVPRTALDKVRALVPGAESPTILPLEGDVARVAVHVVCHERVFWEHLEDLKAAGASAVLVLPVEKMLT